MYKINQDTAKKLLAGFITGAVITTVGAIVYNTQIYAPKIKIETVQEIEDKTTQAYKDDYVNLKDNKNEPSPYVIETIKETIEENEEENERFSCYGEPDIKTEFDFYPYINEVSCYILVDDTIENVEADDKYYSYYKEVKDYIEESLRDYPYTKITIQLMANTGKKDGLIRNYVYSNISGD